MASVAEMRGRLTNGSLLRSDVLIDGKWTGAASGATIDVTDPFTGKLVGTIPSLSDAEVRGAVAAAEAAFPKWSRELNRHRGALLRRWWELVIEHQEDLARLITLENGKPLKEARAEIGYGAQFIEFSPKMRPASSA